MSQPQPTTLAEFLTQNLKESLELKLDPFGHEDWLDGFDTATTWVLDLIKEFNDKTS